MKNINVLMQKFYDLSKGKNICLNLCHSNYLVTPRCLNFSLSAWVKYFERCAWAVVYYSELI